MPRRSGKPKQKCSPVASCESTGQTPISIAMSAMLDETPNTLTSSAAGSHARTLAPQARELASLVLAAAYGPNSHEWSTSFHQSGLSSRTSHLAPGVGSTPFADSWGNSAMRRYRSRLRQAMLAHRISASASSLLPTLSASDYGTSNNGDPHDGRGSYATKGTKSLSALSASGELHAKLMAHGLLPTLTVKGNYALADGVKEGDGLSTALEKLGFPGPLSPTFCEWILGAPIGWTDVLPLAMELFPSAPRSLGT